MLSIIKHTLSVTLKRHYYHCLLLFSSSPTVLGEVYLDDPLGLLHVLIARDVQLQHPQPARALLRQRERPAPLWEQAPREHREAAGVQLQREVVPEAAVTPGHEHPAPRTFLLIILSRWSPPAAACDEEQESHAYERGKHGDDLPG